MSSHLQQKNADLTCLRITHRKNISMYKALSLNNYRKVIVKYEDKFYLQVSGLPC